MIDQLAKPFGLGWTGCHMAGAIVSLLYVFAGQVRASKSASPKLSLSIHTKHHLIIAETNNMIPSVITLVELAPH
jgi:hypothetical protein